MYDNDARAKKAPDTDRRTETRPIATDGGTDADPEGYDRAHDELWDGLLTAYAAGFAKAIEVFKPDAGIDPTVRNLKASEAVRDQHYYFWDGRDVPLNDLLHRHFGLDAGYHQPTVLTDGGHSGYLSEVVDRAPAREGVVFGGEAE